MAQRTLKVESGQMGAQYVLIPFLFGTLFFSLSLLLITIIICFTVNALYILQSQIAYTTILGLG